MLPDKYSQAMSVLRHQPVTPSFSEVAAIVRSSHVNASAIYRRYFWFGAVLCLVVCGVPTDLRVAEVSLASHRANTQPQIPPPSSIARASEYALVSHALVSHTVSMHSAPQQQIQTEAIMQEALTTSDAVNARNMLAQVPKLDAVGVKEIPLPNTVPGMMVARNDYALQKQHDLPISLFASIGFSSNAVASQLPAFSIGVAYQLTSGIELSAEFAQNHSLVETNTHQLVLHDTTFEHESQQYPNTIGHYSTLTLASSRSVYSVAGGIAYCDRVSPVVLPVVGVYFGTGEAGPFVAERVGLNVPIAAPIHLAFEAQAMQLIRPTIGESMPLTFGASFSYSW